MSNIIYNIYVMPFLFSTFIVGNIVVRSCPILRLNISVVTDVGLVGVRRLIMFTSLGETNNPPTPTTNNTSVGEREISIYTPNMAWGQKLQQSYFLKRNLKE